MKQRLKTSGLDAEVTGREKQLYSIYKKMLRKRATLNEIVDVYGLRIVVNSVDTCYRALGIVHSLWQATVNRVPVRFALFSLSTFCLLALSVLAVIATLG